MKMNEHVKYLLKMNIGLLILFLPVFLLVMVLLELIAAITGLSYETINVIVYYVIIPLSWFILLIIVRGHMNSPLFSPLGSAVFPACKAKGITTDTIPSTHLPDEPFSIFFS